MPWRDELTRIRSRSLREWALALEAFLLLGLFRGATLLLPFAWIIGLLKLETRPPGAPALPFVGRAFRGTQASPVRWAILAAARRTPWESNCLPQALAALVLLRQRGLDGAVALGAATQGEDRELRAHAWLIVDGRILLGERGVATFAPISTFVRAGEGVPQS